MPNIYRLVGEIFLIPALIFNTLLFIKLIRDSRTLKHWYHERHEILINVLAKTSIETCPLCRAAESACRIEMSFSIDGEEGEQAPVTVQPETDGFHVITGGPRTPDGQSGLQRLPCAAVHVRGFSRALLQQMLEEKYGGSNHGKTARTIGR